MKKFVNRGTQVGAIKTTDERVGRPARGLPLHYHTQCQSPTPPSIHLSFSSAQNSLKCCTIEATDSYFRCNLSFEHFETQQTLIHPLLARSRFVVNATSPFIHFLSQHPTSQSPSADPAWLRISPAPAHHTPTSGLVVQSLTAAISSTGMTVCVTSAVSTSWGIARHAWVSKPVLQVASYTFCSPVNDVPCRRKYSNIRWKTIPF